MRLPGAWLVLVATTPQRLYAFQSATPWTTGSPLRRGTRTAASVEEEVTETQTRFDEDIKQKALVEDNKDVSTTSTASNPLRPRELDDEKRKQFEQDYLMAQIELESDKIVDAMMNEECEIDYENTEPASELCVEDSLERTRFRDRLKSIIRGTVQVVRGSTDTVDTEGLSEGEILEKGWEQRASASALVRNAEVWKFVLKSAFTVLNARKAKLKGATEKELQDAQTKAAEYIRDGFLKLGPSFVKLGQVASTRTDVLPATYTDVLKTLTDDVPGFSGEKAKEIVSAELGVPVDEIFQDFSEECVKAASLGQVHTAMYKGTKVAVKGTLCCTAAFGQCLLLWNHFAVSSFRPLQYKGLD